MRACCRLTAPASPFALRARGMASLSAKSLFLGLDSSTQGLKATAIDRDFKVHASFAINYQKDLPHYALKNGVHAKAGNVVTQPTLMVRRRRRRCGRACAQGRRARAFRSPPPPLPFPP